MDAALSGAHLWVTQYHFFEDIQASQHLWQVFGLSVPSILDIIQYQASIMAAVISLAHSEGCLYPLIRVLCISMLNWLTIFKVNLAVIRIKRKIR